MAYKVHIAPTVEPVTLEEARRHVKVDGEDHDADLLGLISTARIAAENYMSRKIINTTINEYFNDFSGGVLRLSLGSVQESGLEIRYAGADGENHTLSADKYQLDNVKEPCRIYISDIPTLKDGAINPIKVQYVSGYGASAADVPKDVIDAIKLKIADLFEHPTDAPRTLTQASTRLLFFRRVHAF